MGTILDIIGSMIIRGAIVAVILTLNVNLHNALYQKTARTSVKESIAIPAQLMLADIKLAGYGKLTSKTFLIAQAEEIKFYSDVNDDSTAETVRYYLSPVVAGVTHRTLYREVSSIGGGAPQAVGQNIVSLVIKYFNINGTQLSYGSPKSGIKSILVQITMESPSLIAETLNQGVSRYQRGFWERQIFPRNL